MSKTQEVLEDYTREAILQAVEAVKPILRQNYRREFLEELIAAGSEIGDEFIYDYTDDGKRMYTSLTDWLRSHMEPEG